ncbi:hypothetical protein FXO37_34338 [Capsicum annuum]|nr:hypothetical protein FXO37_34338 [Capsicum annuum]
MNDDLLSEKKAFDDSKAGVKGLVDAGIVDIPRIFIRPPDELAQELSRCRLQRFRLRNSVDREEGVRHPSVP